MLIPDVHEKNLRIGWGFGVFLVALFVAFCILAIAIIVGYVAFHLYILWDLYQHPSFSAGVSICVIAFVLLTDFLSISLNALNGWPIAVRDYTNSSKLGGVDKFDPVTS